MKFSKIFVTCRRGTSLCAAAALFCLFPIAVMAAIPQTINYQGFLVSKLTNTAVDSPQDMHFLIYDSVSGGAPLWTEYRCNVSVSRGRYDVEIGSSTPGGIPASVFQNQTQGLWLEIQVDPDGDCSGTYEALQPRVRLQASPFAFNSLYASTASAGPVYSPTGTPPFSVDIIGTHEQTTNGAVTISSNLYVMGGISVGSISPGMQLSVGGKVESKGNWPDCAPEGVPQSEYTCGFVFPDGSVQVKASGDTMWNPTNSGMDLFNTNIGNVGISTTTPVAKLHISTGDGETGVVFRIDTGTTPVFQVKGTGWVDASYFHGDGSNLTAVNDTTKVKKYGYGDRISASLTISSPSWNNNTVNGTLYYGGAVAGSSLTVTDARGIIARRLEFINNVSISSTTPAASGPGQWAGLYVSTHIYLAPGARFFGDGTGITGVISEDATKVFKNGDTMYGHLMLNSSSMTIITSNTVSAAYSLAVTTDASQQSWHLYLSTTGNMGVGTSNLTHKLQVEGGILAASSITAQTGFYTPGPINANTITSVYGITASSGTFGSWGPTQYSIETTSGILVTHGLVSAPFFAGNGAQLTNVSGTDNTKVAKTGDTMSGPLQMNGALTVTYSSFTVISSNTGSAYTMVISTVADPNYYSLVVTPGGYVGVHLPNPTANLDVFRNLQITNLQATDSDANLTLKTFSGHNYIKWVDNSLMGTTNQGVLGFLAGSRSFVYRTAASNPQTAGAEVFRIKSDFEGNWAFGIGTADPKTQLHVNTDMLVGPDLTNPTLFISTGTASISVATTTVSHKLVVNGGILAVSSVTAVAGLYGTHYGDVYTSSFTVGNTKGEDVATVKIGERYGNNYTLVVGTTNAVTDYYDMVMTPDGQMGLGVNVPQAQLHTVKSIRIGSYNETQGNGAVLNLDPLGGATYLHFGEFGYTDKGSFGFSGGSRDLSYKVNSGDIGSGDELMRIMGVGGTILRSSLTVTGAYGLAATEDVLKVGSVPGSALFVVTKDGRTGVNVSASPTYTLDVNGGGVVRSSFVVTGAVGLSGIQTALQVLGSTLNVRMDGRIGIGTTNPAWKVDINGDAIVRSSFSVLGAGLAGTQSAFSVVGSTLVVRADGVVGIGVANPATITNRLEVNGTVKASGFVAGWEYVFNTCSAPIQVCSAPCTGGKKVMGGGCSINETGTALQDSYPSSDGLQWNCKAVSALTLNDMKAYAICSTVQ